MLGEQIKDWAMLSLLMFPVTGTAFVLGAGVGANGIDRVEPSEKEVTTRIIFKIKANYSA